MKFLKNMKIKNKLFLLLAIPLSAILYISGNTIIEKLNIVPVLMSATIVESSRNSGEATDVSNSASDTTSQGGQMVSEYKVN